MKSQQTCRVLEACKIVPVELCGAGQNSIASREKAFLLTFAASGKSKKEIT